MGGEGGDWSIDIGGEISRVNGKCVVVRVHICCGLNILRRPLHQDALSFFTPEDLRRAEEAGEFDINANILHLRPDPMEFVGYLKSVGRVDISSDIFVKLLEAYQEARRDSEADPTKYVFIYRFRF